MATVFEACDLRHGRHVGVKVFRPGVGVLLGSRRFLREIEIVSALQHPHIVPLFESGHVDELLYYVMACAEGGSLSARLAREKQLALDEALEIARQVASALSFAHSRGVIHRDINPGKTLLPGDQAGVADSATPK